MGGLCDLSSKSGREWQLPTNKVEREFAIDMLIQQLVEVQSSPLGTLVKLTERAIKWLIKES